MERRRTQETQMLLADAGNSRLTLARLDGATIGARIDLERESITPGSVVQAIDALGGASRALLGSVVPALTAMLVDALTVATGAPPHLVSRDSPHGLTLDVPHPSQAGADRIATAVGALVHAAPPLIVVDCGTATTCTLIDRGDHAPRYRGGAIAAGVETALTGLRRRAPHLPEPADTVEIPGTTTEIALALGGVAGHAWMVDAVVARLVAAAAGATAAVIVTGGCAPRIRPHLATPHDHRPDLCLEGLAAIAARLTDDGGSRR